MRIELASVFVDDQEKAERFYTDVLGFVKKMDLPIGDHRWLTVVSPDDPDGAQLVLEPNSNPIAETYQQQLKEAGIPATSFGVEDVRAEHERLTKAGVAFAVGPTDAGPTVVATFDDTCGNLIQIHQR